ncbi:flavin-containing monooxygenase [Novosphingobium colocasiae]|uniref:flavin-containing monooxygenase n=1 Tax=Novosphingobium colocasiae TaxID=1256513 RepID=UPI0035B0B951
MSDKEALRIAAIREKYEAERARRLRPAGTDQYVFTEGRHAHFADDPYAGPPPARAALDEELDVLVIGAGFGGIEAGATLRRKGIGNFRILDAAGDFGGTWYWNRYPGLRCDVESYIYLPYLEETGYVPTERYVRGREILAYCQQLGRHFDLYDRALFQTKVTGMVWDEDAARWIVSTSRGDTLRARFVTTQSGIFSRPQLPGIPGIEDFAGHAFHSARWDYAYTGGSTDGGLTGLAGKRVGVVGTGTTALQVVPELAKDAGSLTIFQRTPTAVGVRDNGPTDRDWFRALSPGWQRQRIESFNQIGNGEEADCPVDDGWARFFRLMMSAAQSVPEPDRTLAAIGAAQEAADFEHNEVVRARVDQHVRDPEKAALLKAYYRTMCKRPGFSDDYLPACDRDNVRLVDVSGGIERITPAGIVVDGVEYPLDCLIFCTGFELGTTWAHQAGYDVIGRGGQRLSDKWANGISTYHGLFSRGFPNMFFMGLTQTGATVSVPHMLQEQVDHLTWIIERLLSRDRASVEAEADAEAAWQATIAAVNEARRPFQESCTPGYFNAEGKPQDRRSAIGSGMFFPSTAFFRMLAEWRAAGNFAGLELQERHEMGEIP